jgi:hypothetical protein
LAKGGRFTIPASTKKRLGEVAQPKEDKVKKLVLGNLRYQNPGEVEIRSSMYFPIGKAVFSPTGTRMTPGPFLELTNPLFSNTMNKFKTGK